jgi:cell division protease FtsH
MVCDWGMSSRIGPIRYAPPEETTPWGSDFVGAREHSDATAHEIDQEIEGLIGGAFQEAKDLLQRNREALQRIAEALLKHESLSADEVHKELEGLTLQKPPSPPPPSNPPLAS